MPTLVSELWRRWWLKRLGRQDAPLQASQVSRQAHVAVVADLMRARHLLASFVELRAVATPEPYGRLQDEVTIYLKSVGYPIRQRRSGPRGIAVQQAQGWPASEPWRQGVVSCCTCSHQETAPHGAALNRQLHRVGWTLRWDGKWRCPTCSAGTPEPET